MSELGPMSTNPAEWESAEPRTPYAIARDREDARLCTLLDEIREREQLINSLQAEQVQAVAEFVEGRRVLERDRFGVWDNSAERICAAELADARKVGVSTAMRHMWASETLVDHLPRVMDKFEAGAISLASARAAAWEIYPLQPEARPLADEIIAEEIDQVLPGQVGPMVRTRVMEIDPDAAIEATRSARRERAVWTTPSAPLGMSYLTASLPSEQAAACWTALHGYARSARADGDPRTVSQIMADALVERVTGQTRATDVDAHVNIVMTDLTLVGLDDRPAVLQDAGPIPAQIARLIATSGSAWLRRLFCDPADGSVATIDTKRRRFDGKLRELILARDRRCRMPSCNYKIIDVDHVREHCLGGETCASNGRGYCQGCHHMRDHPGLRAASGLPATLSRWTTPIGAVMSSIPPTAMDPGQATRAQLRHRRSLLAKAATIPPSEGSAAAVNAGRAAAAGLLRDPDSEPPWHPDLEPTPRPDLAIPPRFDSDIERRFFEYIRVHAA